MSSEPVEGTDEPSASDAEDHGEHEKLTGGPAPEFPPQGADAFLVVAQGRFEHQMATLDALDNKAQAMFAGGVAEVGFLIAMLALRPADRPLSAWSWAGIFAVVLIAIWVLGYAWAAQRIREWDAYPGHEKTWELGYAPMPLAWEMGLSLAAAHEENEKGRKEKTRQVKRAGVGVLVMTVAVALTAVAIVGT